MAIGCAGIGAILDHRGTTDTQGRELQVTEVAVVDELAGVPTWYWARPMASRSPSSSRSTPAGSVEDRSVTRSCETRRKICSASRAPSPTT